MSGQFAKITDTELTVLKTLWKDGPCTARVVAEHIYGQSNETEIGTVHSLLLRLEKKGFVGRDRSSQPHIFSAAVDQVQLAGHQLEQMAEKLSDGSLSPFITHLFNTQKLGPDEIEKIRTLLDELPKPPGV